MNSTPAVPDDRQERSARRRPFSTWVKKLANFKHGSSSAEGGRHGPFKRDGKKQASKMNNPYPQSGRVGTAPPVSHSQPSLSTNQTDATAQLNANRSHATLRSSIEVTGPAHALGASRAPTISTDLEASQSINAPSHMTSSVAGTSRTANGGLDSRKGGDSTFSSPALSVRSLTTTLTTIQSMGNANITGNTIQNQSHSSSQNHQSTIQFSQPFPSVSPASAIPPHLAPPHHANPTTYITATANNLLTDNASILTLASSSKRRRRRSFDTDASVRALAPSSIWGGSRESLPLSVLSGNVDGSSALHQTNSRLQANERNSIYSSTGIAPTVPTERNSLYAKQGGDAGSIRSSLPGHGLVESVNGSPGGLASPLASPRAVLEKETWPRDKDDKS